MGECPCWGRHLPVNASDIKNTHDVMLSRSDGFGPEPPGVCGRGRTPLELRVLGVVDGGR
jgi:hypothetical protein